MTDGPILKNSLKTSFGQLWKNSPLWRFTLLGTSIATAILLIYSPWQSNIPPSIKVDPPVPKIFAGGHGLNGNVAPPPLPTLLTPTITIPPRPAKLTVERQPEAKRIIEHHLLGSIPGNSRHLTTHSGQKIGEDATDASDVTNSMDHRQVSSESTYRSIKPSPQPKPDLIDASMEMVNWLDGTSQKVKNSCQSLSNREPSKSVMPGTTQVRVRAEGVWCFFDSTGQPYDIRVEAPFSGSIAGIRIGDSLIQLQQVLGNPIKRVQIAPNMPETLFYKLGNSFLLRIQLTRSDLVETMFIVR